MPVIDLDLHARLVAFSAEAKGRSVGDIYRVREDQNMIPRIARTALGGLLQSEKIRLVTANRLARCVGNKAVIGHGSEQLVLDDGKNVLKFLFHSITPDVKLVEEAAEKLQSDADKCQAYYGDFWLPTQFEPITVTKGRRHAVIARQPKLDNPRLHSSVATVTPSNETREIGANILRLHDDTGLLPDLNGLNNIATRSDTGRLCLLDTIPVTPEAQAIQPYGADRKINELILDHVKHMMR